MPAWTRNGQTVAFAERIVPMSDGDPDEARSFKLRVCNSVSGEDTGAIDFGLVQPTFITFTPDESRIVVGNANGEITMWSSKTFQQTFALRDHSAAITALCFTKDGRRLVSISMDGRIVAREID
jgi:WD40 repeat protein